MTANVGGQAPDDAAAESPATVNASVPSKRCAECPRDSNVPRPALLLPAGGKQPACYPDGEAPCRDGHDGEAAVRRSTKWRMGGF